MVVCVSQLLLRFYLLLLYITSILYGSVGHQQADSFSVVLCHLLIDVITTTTTPIFNAVCTKEYGAWVDRCPPAGVRGVILLGAHYFPFPISRFPNFPDSRIFQGFNMRDHVRTGKGESYFDGTGRDETGRGGTGTGQDNRGLCFDGTGSWGLRFAD